MQKISILGSTGSIGTQTLDIIRRHKDRFEAVGLAAYGTDKDVDLMVKQVKEFKPKVVAMYLEEGAEKLKERLKQDLPGQAKNIVVSSGQKGLVDVSIFKDTYTVVTAVVGSVGLLPTLEAIKRKKDIALANKETLVCAGELVMKAVKENHVSLMPIDSEHSAILQSLRGNRLNDLRKIIVTCSGGPFREWTNEKIDGATREQALKHPTWNMGGKITIDSASLMNKGLEVIEAHWLYDTPYENIEVVVHPQSIIHSMVEYIDGSIMAQLGVHDMRLPIQYALSCPERLESGEYAFLDLVKTGQFTFFAPNFNKFPCLGYAYSAGKLGGTMPAVMNAANEVAVVEYFLQNKIKFGDIPRAVKHAMDSHKGSFKTGPVLEDILRADEWAREHTRSVLDVVIADKSWKTVQSE